MLAMVAEELFQFDGDFQTSLDLAQLSHSKVKTLVEQLAVLKDKVGQNELLSLTRSMA